MNKTIVIIPTIGAPELEFAIQSVLNQTVPTDVLVAFDGAQFVRPLNIEPDPRVHTMVLPFNTASGRTHNLPAPGMNHWFGQRVMCATAFVVNNDYTMFLDQDNWLRPDHVESCSRFIEARPLAPFEMVFSLRNVHRKDGSFVCRDNCLSLGLWEGIAGQLIDTSCYFLRTDFLLKNAHHFLYGWGGDRHFLEQIMRHHGKSCIGSTGKYTVHYRLGSGPTSTKEDLFLQGNAYIDATVGELKPWAKE